MMINYGIIIMYKLYKKKQGDDCFIHDEEYLWEANNRNRTYIGAIESQRFLERKAYNMSEYEENVKGIMILESNIIRLKEKELI